MTNLPSAISKSAKSGSSSGEIADGMRLSAKSVVCEGWPLRSAAVKSRQRLSPFVHDFPDELVAYAVLRGPIRLPDALFTAGKSNRIAPLQVVRHDRVVGAPHLRSAALHALRAEREGRMQAKTIEVEFIRYLAGERQIQAAIAKMGLPDTPEGGTGFAGCIAVSLGPKRMDALQHFVHSLGLLEDDALLAATPERLHAFGVTETMLAATTPSHHADLALELVAAVDGMRT